MSCNSAQVSRAESELTGGGQLRADVDVCDALLVEKAIPLMSADVEPLRQQCNHAVDSERVQVGGVHLHRHVGGGRLVSETNNLLIY